MRYFALLLTLAILTAGVAPSANHPYRRKYVTDTFGRSAALGVGGGAAIQQMRNSPHEWGGGVAGFGKRVASGFGTHVVKNTIEFGVASARHEELGYQRSGKRGFGPRLKYALVSTVVTRKTTTGKRTPAVGRMSGAFGSGLISRAWQPARLHTVGSGLATGGIMLGTDAGLHVAREFWPQRHRALSR
ncbi:MAG TPA: hypothetical protein VEU96_28740 [Bryobacteraceae bacterium]|nr:hypothetical protein [Bryobacteraceae bacterium]